ncbi:hypothetical protein [Butyrivibrio proteoclasticus]|uniref:hypothetical protein n=1 Tax=Butyrivibrio proteoclasticus TaxID=43305 RepID=UPI00047C82AB|nr:hypothetical protein [Butyrivibrio proteoclasticus]
MIIIVTGTIAPSSGIKQLELRNTNERLLQYKSALVSLLISKPNASIVFCDNSGFDTESFMDIQSIAKDNRIKFELLSFKGNDEAVIKHGKGYGEGEIIKYVLTNSRLAKDDNYMIKLTGRLQFVNISDLVKRVQTDRIYFNVPNRRNRKIYDTRIYAMPIDVFKTYFIEAYKRVDDNKGYYIEHSYTDVILENQIMTRNFPVYPRIVGNSGSGGFRYEYKEWKAKIKDLASKTNFYGRLKRII